MQTRTLLVEFETAVHHGSGFGIAGLVDRAVLRNGAGLPYLAGSALKGKFRHAALQLAGAEAAAGEMPCRPPDLYCRMEPVCEICSIFGSPMHPAGLAFEDAYPPEGERAALESHMKVNRARPLPGGSDVRASTAIDPRRNVAKRYHLFTTETISPLVSFQAELRGDLNGQQEQLLSRCALILTHFGAGASRGLGLCRYTVGDPRVEW